MLRRRLACGMAGGAASAVLAGLLAVVPSVAMAQAGGVTFNPPTDFPVGLTPASVAVADFNGDDRPDLAVANFGAVPSTVSVLLNDGFGGFINRTDFPVGVCPASAAVGDLNGDGRPDLAVANFCENTVSVLFNDGSGGFANRTDWLVGFAPQSVAVGDFNTDGNPDLAVANLGDHTVSVLLNDGSGGFANHTAWPVGGSLVSVAVGDFNTDGSPDLAVADNSTNRILSVLLNDGSGGFANRTDWLMDLPPWSVTVGDFNNDGNPDLATANTTGQVSSVSVLLNDGSGGFANRTDWPVGPVPRSVAVGDFNMDGNPDLATANSLPPTHSVSVLLNDGSAGFADRTDFIVGAQPISVAVGDFNGDSRPDLATANSAGNSVSVLLNTTGSNAPPTITVAAGGRCVTGTSGSINLRVGDAESPAGDLVVTVTSSNQVLVPDANITVGGSGADRTLSVATVASQTGSAVVTLQVSDGTNTSPPVDVTVIAGRPQAEKIGGTAHPDMIFGKNGDDSIGGRDGNDLLCGGNGNDSLGGNAGDDTMYGANGDDLLSGAAGADYFSGGNGTDTAEDLNAAEGDTEDGTIP